MTRKDYIAIAAALNARIAEIRYQEYDTVDEQARIAEVYNIAEALALVMAQDNPRFDASRFLTACGV